MLQPEKMVGKGTDAASYWGCLPIFRCKLLVLGRAFYIRAWLIDKVMHHLVQNHGFESVRFVHLLLLVMPRKKQDLTVSHDASF